MVKPVDWFLVQLKPNGFKRAVVNLERQGFTTFMPMRLRKVRRANKNNIQKSPLFPGYLFVGIDPVKPSWSKINSTYGVLRMVNFGKNTPQPLPDTLIAGLKLRCNDESILLPPDDLKVGEKVRIVSGPFADYVATIESIPTQTRLGIIFDFMSQKTKAKIFTSEIEKIY